MRNPIAKPITYYDIRTKEEKRITTRRSVHVKYKHPTDWEYEKRINWTWKKKQQFELERN